MAALLGPAAATVGRFLFGSTLRTLATTTVGSGVGYLGYKEYKSHKQAQAAGNDDIPLAPPSQEPVTSEINPHQSQYTG